MPHRQGRDRRRVDPAGQECADGHVGTHVLGDRILEYRGDLVVASLLGVGHERHGGEPGDEVPRHLGRTTGPDAGVAARLQPAHAAVQGLGLRHVLQHGVVLQCALVDGEVDVGDGSEVQKALLLAADDRAARTGRHEHRLDAEGVARAEQFSLDGVPQREREHASQAMERVGAPVVVGGEDRLAVTVGGEHGPVTRRQFVPQFEVVVDLAVEDQLVASRLLGRSPAQRLVAVGDVDDGQPVEAEDHCRCFVVVRPGPRLVGTAVTHEMSGSGYRIHQLGGWVSGRVAQVGQQSAHWRQYAERRGVTELTPRSLRSCPRVWSTLRSIRPNYPL